MGVGHNVTEKYLKEYKKHLEKESPLDGECKYEIVSGFFPRHLMEKTGLIQFAGKTGKTRIVIEYNNDTGEGWRRIVAEDERKV